MVRKFALLFGVIALGLLVARGYQQVSSRADGTPNRAPATATTISATATTTTRATPVPGKAAPIRVELSEQEVNHLLQEGLAGSGYQIDDLSVRLEEGRFVATTKQQIAFVRVPVSLVGEASVVDGQLTIRPVKVSASGVTVPQALVDQMMNVFRTQLAAGMQNLPVRLSSVEIHPGKLVVEGTRK